MKKAKAVFVFALVCKLGWAQDCKPSPDVVSFLQSANTAEADAKLKHGGYASLSVISKGPFLKDSGLSQVSGNSAILKSYSVKLALSDKNYIVQVRDPNNVCGYFSDDTGIIFAGKSL